MTDLVVVTALLGNGPDRLGPPPPVAEGVRYCCVTDRRRRSRPAGNGCRIPARPAHPACRRAGCARVSSTAFREPLSLWLDASFDVLVSPRRFVEECHAPGCRPAGVSPSRSPADV